MRVLGQGRPRAALAALVLVLVALVTAGSFTPATAQAAPAPPTDSLPEPFRDWDVEVGPHADDPSVLDLIFDSPVLGKRITNRVYVPHSYSEDGPQWPVMYYLHGTIEPALDSPAGELTRPVTRHEALLDAIGPGGGARQTDIFDFGTQLDRARFLLVAPDTSYDDTVCETCIWIDGRPDPVPNVPPVTAETLQADTFLHQELYPLVESLFNVRTDRGGRGVMGFSMGAVAAYLQGMRHPDQYAVTASVSGILDVLDEPGGRAIWESLGYMRDQGYGTGVTNQAEWRGFNPMDLVTNLSGVDHEVFSSTGDVCLPPSSLTHPDCLRLPAATNPGAAAVEAILARQHALNEGVLPGKDVKETRDQLPGVHGANNHRIYAEDVVPLANSVFAREVRDPATFGYRSTASEFSVWGYDATVRRPDVGFLDMTDARSDGRAFTLTGAGQVAITTPPTFTPGQSYEVTATAEDGTTTTHPAVADAAGRLPVVADLGSGTVVDQLLSVVAPGPTRTVGIDIG